MTVKDILSPIKLPPTAGQAPVEADMPVLQALPRLLEAPEHMLAVASEEGKVMGYVTETSLLEGLGRLLPSESDQSEIVVECRRGDYSASAIAHAVEDSDAHLYDLITTPVEEGKMRVTIRVGHSDPTAAVRSLERYGYEVIEAHGADSDILTSAITTERLLSLQALLNV